MTSLGAGITIQPLDTDLWRITDTCNVYLVKHQDHAIAIDFGSGNWVPCLESLGIRTLDHVLLTHHHADQCQGLLNRPTWPFQIHAPAGEQPFLDPHQVASYHALPRPGRGCPSSYAVLPQGIPGVRHDLQGFDDFWWHRQRIRCLHTPGHGPNALSFVVDHQGKQVVFCGDAAHAGATIRQPFHLEWDHWTGAGALAAWEGVQRLLGIRIDRLCPSHGPAINGSPREMLTRLADRLMPFYHAKGQISPDQPDLYVEPEPVAEGVRRYLPHLYQFGTNGYLLLSETQEALIVDPQVADFPAMERLLALLPGVRPTAATVSHYHLDHCDGIPELQKRYGTQSWLHPEVAAPLRDPQHTLLPWQPPYPIIPDHLWPTSGKWSWHEYDFNIAHWPGQTWAHAAFMTTIDRQKVFFAGDSFQPASRWNGTGGFCAYNNSRFRDGFIPSAHLIQEWSPNLVAAGHGCCYHYSTAKFTKIAHWAETAAKAAEALCPSGDMDVDYYAAAAVYAAHLKTTAPERRATHVIGVGKAD